MDDGKNNSVHKASRTWDMQQSLEEIEARIHDGWPIGKLHERADRHINSMIEVGPFLRLPEPYSALEIGPGVGYLMQALDRRKKAHSIVGVDIAPNMAERARERMNRDNLCEKPFRFDVYDGIKLPYHDDYFDFVYSIATLQHVPKPSVYNLMMEASRVVKPSGFVAIQLLGPGYIEKAIPPFAQEVQNQISGSNTHWHHWHTTTEVEVVLRRAMNMPFAFVRSEETWLWAYWCKDWSAIQTL
jgi:ubiquinone/menaquinone biosynthesis C-methylase UbiE